MVEEMYEELYLNRFQFALILKIKELEEYYQEEKKKIREQESCYLD